MFCVCMYVWPACVYVFGTMCVTGICRDQMRMLDFEIILSHCVGTENQA